MGGGRGRDRLPGDEALRGRGPRAPEDLSPRLRRRARALAATREAELAVPRNRVDGVGHDGVVSLSAFQVVGHEIPGEEPVVPGAPEDRVGAGPTSKLIVARASVDGVVPGAG